MLRGILGAGVLPMIAALPVDPDDAEDRVMAGGAYGEVSQRLCRLYWSTPPRPLFEAVYAHVRLGADLFRGASAGERSRLVEAVALSALLASRLAFFDLGRVGAARSCQDIALAAASESGDHTLLAAVLGHMAFGPAFAGDADQARALTAAALTSAQRSSSIVRSWLHCVASEAEARAGNGLVSRREADQAEVELAIGEPAPEWFDFYDPARMQCFAGYAALAAGDHRLACERLGLALANLDSDAAKQRSVVAADLAAAHIGDADRVAYHLHEAVDVLQTNWYRAGWDRVREARSSLGDSRLGRQLDERMISLAGASRA